ncbi:molybdenum cofactor guanylyltransferase MobA [Paracoccus sp. (in: a-proteobacteria)]|uniref:molybdenum cofactor guanylyltransferase MobA n=1 Tax=Paracoccus sp. TaxID=267 RepID=UPI003919F9C3
MKPPAMILAGGRATRMNGADKPLLALGGRPLLALLLDRLGPQVGPVAVNANGDPARYAAFGLPVVGDSLPDWPGPLAGVLAAMDWAVGLGADQVLTVAGDTPFLPPDLVARLAAARGLSGLALAATREGDALRDHPTCGLWPVGLRGDLAATLARDQRRVRDFTARHQPGLAVWPGGADDPFANINTPEDLTRAGARLAAS